MKKKVIKRKYRELPKYVLGTMKPIDLGYQPGRGIGSAQMTTQPGVSLDPETQAVKANTWPTAANSLMQQLPFIKNNLDGFGSASSAATTATSGSFNFGKAAAEIANYASGGVSTVAASAAPAGTTTIHTLSGDLSVAPEMASETTASGTSAGSNALKIGGKALGAIGAAYGLANMGMQIGDFGSHRTAADMQTNMGRQFYTTDKGNTYDAYMGPNINQELAYENANARSKQTNWALSSIGTGASIGSLFSPIGTAIGALGGAIIGGLGSLFGWGDNEEEVKKEARMLADNVSAYNRQQRAVAESKDTSAEFNDRQSIPAAADGKNAYGPMGSLKKYSVGKSYSIGPHGWSKEINSLGTGQEVIWDTDSRNPEGEIVPGNPKEGDVKPMSVDKYDPSVVISLQNPYHPIAKIIVKEQKKLNKIQANASGSKEQQELQIREAEKMKQINNEKMKAISMYNPANLKRNKYSNGKPYTDIEDYLFKPTGLETNNSSSFGLNGVLKGLAMATPHMWGFLQNAANYRRDKYADIRSYNPYVGDPLSERAINDLHRIRFDARPYYNEARKQLNYTNFNTGRNVGLGAGGIEIAKNANFLGYLDKMKDINALANEFNAKHATAAAQLEAQVGQTNQARQIAGNTSWYQWLREAMAAKHANLRTDQLNMYKTFGQGVEDFAKSVYADRAARMNERMMGMYGQQLTNDKIKLLHDLNLWNPTQTIPSLPKESETELDEDTLHYLRGMRARQQLNNIYGTA